VEYKKNMTLGKYLIELNLPYEKELQLHQEQNLAKKENLSQWAIVSWSSGTDTQNGK